MERRLLVDVVIEGYQPVVAFARIELELSDPTLGVTGDVLLLGTAENETSSAISVDLGGGGSARISPMSRPAIVVRYDGTTGAYSSHAQLFDLGSRAGFGDPPRVLGVNAVGGFAVLAETVAGLDIEGRAISGPGSFLALFNAENDLQNLVEFLPPASVSSDWGSSRVGS